jgi:hypothetical protein
MFMAPILPAASLSPMNHLKALADAFWLMAILAAFILSIWIGLRPLREALSDRAFLQEVTEEIQLVSFET